LQIVGDDARALHRARHALYVIKPALPFTSLDWNRGSDEKVASVKNAISASQCFGCANGVFGLCREY
jgi:hypothetical protein